MAYCTSAEVKSYIGLTSNADDALISGMINEAQDIIEKTCGQAFEATADATRKFDAVRDTNGATLYLDKPLAAITSITNGNNTTVTTAQYVTEPRNSNEFPFWAIKLLSSSGVSWTYTNDPENAISIVGKWAYSTTPPSAIKNLCVKAAGALYRVRENPIGETIVLEGQTFATPKDVAEYVRKECQTLGLIRL